MSSTIDRKLLAKIKLFEEFSDQQVEAVARIMHTRTCKAGEMIIKEGEVGSEVFVLLSGEIEISKKLTLYSLRDGPDSKDKSLVRLKDEHNVFFGEMSLFGESERSASVSALSDVTLGVITRERMRLLTDNDPALGHKLYFNIGKTLAENLRRANRDILKLTTAFCLALEGK